MYPPMPPSWPEVSLCILITFSFSSSCGTPIVCMLMLLMISHRSEALFIFLHSFFSVFKIK